MQQNGGNSLSRSEYFPIHGNTNLSPPSFQNSSNGQWSDETPLSEHLNSPQQTSADSLALSSEDTGGGLSFSPLSSNFASVQPLPAVPTLADFAHQGEAVFPAEKFQTLITMYRAHSQHIMDLVRGHSLIMYCHFDPKLTPSPPLRNPKKTILPYHLTIA